MYGCADVFMVVLWLFRRTFTLYLRHGAREVCMPYLCEKLSESEEKSWTNSLFGLHPRIFDCISFIELRLEYKKKSSSFNKFNYFTKDKN